MELPRDILSPGLYVKPRLFLCNTNKERICKLDTTDTRGTFKFNSYSELSFVTARVYNDLMTGETRVNPFFDKIEALRLIEIEDIGYFELQGPELTSNGIEEKKSCTAYSLEYTLSQKYLDKFYINMGTVDSKEVLNSENGKIVPITLYNQDNPKLSLLHLVLEEIYGWRVGHVDASLKTLSRQFEIDRESVYDFLMNEVCERFNCYIVFDTLENTINLYAESRTAKFIGDGKTNIFIITPPFSKIGTVSVDGYKTTKWTYNTVTGAIVLEDVPESGAHIEAIDGALTEWETDVFVSFDNLAQEVNISYSADDIKTKLNVTYGDDYDIREVNLGLPYLTDLSYYYTVDWMGQDLYDAYTKYMQTSNNSQLAYSQNSQEILKWSDRIAYEENRLSLEYSLAEHVNGTTVGTYYVKHETTDGYYYSEVSLPSEYNADIQYYSNVDTNVNEDKVKNLYNELKNYFYAYFNKDEDGLSKALDDLKTVLGFEFLTTYTLVNLHDDLKVAATNNNQDDMDAAIYKFLNQLWPELGRTPLTDLYLKPYKTIQEQGIEAGWSNQKDPKNKNYGNYYPVVLFINSIEIAIAERTTTITEYQAERKVYQDANANINNSLSMRENFTEAQLIRLSAFLREDELHIDDIVQTSIDDLSSSFKIKQDAMESGRIELQKLSQPQLQFSMTMANIYALSEFKPIIHQFQLGKVIKVCLRSDYIKQSRLLQVDINFDDFSDFSCSFGELTSLRTQSDIHADLLSQAITAGKSVATNSAAWTRGSDQATALDLKIQQGLLDATTQIKAIDGNQGVVIDKYGIKLQKKNGNEIDPRQAWLVNNMILFSDDGFKTSRSALGEITVDGETRYGLLAEAVLAGYIEGSKIIGGTLSSDNYQSNKSGTHFDLTNGDFEIGGGKIVCEDDKITLDGVTIEWSSTNAPKASQIDGLEDYINQMDGVIRTYSQVEDPSVAWTEEEMAESAGDLWVNPNDGLTKRWDGSSWSIITDSTLKELAQSKAQIFTDTPTPPYYVGDMWVQGANGDILHCVNSKTSEQTYDENDWQKSSKYTDDTLAQQALDEAKAGIASAAEGINLANSAKTAADEAKQQAQDAETNAKKYADDQDNELSKALTEAYENYTDTEISEFDAYVAEYLGLNGGTIIGEDYVISPLIEGGYLNITNVENQSRVIVDPNNLTGNDYIFQIHNGTQITVGVNKDGDAEFSGTVSSSVIEGSEIKGGSININNKFMVDDQGNVTIPSGTIKIGDVDGSSDLAKISDIPTTISQLDNDVGYETATSIKNTVITKDYIETLQVKAGSVDAENIGGTTITGKTINGGNLLIGNKENTYAEITTDGVLNCHGANITGTITATAGEIGGCIIDPEKGLQVSTANITGKLTADSILVTNTNGLTLLSAGDNKVTMGGWNVAYNGLWKSDANGQIRLIPNGNLSTNYTVNEYATKEWVILCGKDNTYNCNFGVTRNGELYASGVNLTGIINATAGGQISGWEICDDGIEYDFIENDEYVYNGLYNKWSKDAYSVANHTRDDWALLLGSNFGVSKNGSLYATSGVIGGWTINPISLSNGDDNEQSIKLDDTGLRFTSLSKDSGGISPYGDLGDCGVQLMTNCYIVYDDSGSEDDEKVILDSTPGHIAFGCIKAEKYGVNGHTLRSYPTAYEMICDSTIQHTFYGDVDFDVAKSNDLSSTKAYIQTLTAIDAEFDSVTIADLLDVSGVLKTKTLEVNGINVYEMLRDLDDRLRELEM